MLTNLGIYLTSKSVNQAEIARRTGLSKSRVNQLISNESTKLEARELYLILLAINEDPGKIFNQLYKDLRLTTHESIDVVSEN